MRRYAVLVVEHESNLDWVRTLFKHEGIAVDEAYGVRTIHERSVALAIDMPGDDEAVAAESEKLERLLWVRMVILERDPTDLSRVSASMEHTCCGEGDEEMDD